MANNILLKIMAKRIYNIRNKVFSSLQLVYLGCFPPLCINTSLLKNNRVILQ